MRTQYQSLEQRTKDIPRVRAGMYLLYAMDKEGFEVITPELDGDDYFFHNGLYPTSTRWIPKTDTTVHVWMHFDHSLGYSGASKILKKMLRDITGEMKFLKAWNMNASLIIDAC
ncbi:MAG: hypothetical protein AABW49_01820 [Nanoarchaeota archaeon]